jgi:single-strand selective monofunctional uracil DNA glycosylase
LWGLFAKRFGSADKFFEEHLVANYCPLAFVEASGRNRTPDKLPANERTTLFAACDEHLQQIVQILEPEWIIGVGDFAGKRARDVIPIIASPASDPVRVGQILHPSPACPASNNNWAGTAAAQLRNLGVWK